MSPKEKIRVKLVGDDAHTAYICLPGHPMEAVLGIVRRTIVLDDIMDYVGPRIHLDLDAEGRLIGIEILAFGEKK